MVRHGFNCEFEGVVGNSNMVLNPDACPFHAHRYVACYEVV